MRLASSCLHSCHNVTGRLHSSSTTRASFFHRSPAPSTSSHLVQKRQTSRHTSTGQTIRPSSHTTKESTQHHDLASFLAYTAARIKINDQPATTLLDRTAAALNQLTTSTVFRGTRYEYLTKHRLEHDLGMTLTRIGGRGDKGVDLLGLWSLPQPQSQSQLQSQLQSSQPPTSTTSPPPTIPRKLRVLVQSKRLASTRRPQPAHLRELEGAMNAAFPPPTNHRPNPLNATVLAWREFVIQHRHQHQHQRQHDDNDDDDLTLQTLGIFVSTAPTTRGVEDVLRASSRAIMYVRLREVELEQREKELGGLEVPETRVEQILWNGAAEETGLGDYDVGVRNWVGGGGGRESSVVSEAVLQWRGRPLRSKGG